MRGEREDLKEIWREGEENGRNLNENGAKLKAECRTLMKVLEREREFLERKMQR